MKSTVNRSRKLATRLCRFVLAAASVPMAQAQPAPSLDIQNVVVSYLPRPRISNVLSDRPAFSLVDGLGRRSRSQIDITPMPFQELLGNGQGTWRGRERTAGERFEGKTALDLRYERARHANDVGVIDSQDPLVKRPMVKLAQSDPVLQSRKASFTDG